MFVYCQSMHLLCVLCTVYQSICTYVVEFAYLVVVETVVYEDLNGFSNHQEDRVVNYPLALTVAVLVNISQCKCWKKIARKIKILSHLKKIARKLQDEIVAKISHREEVGKSNVGGGREKKMLPPFLLLLPFWERNFA